MQHPKTLPKKLFEPRNTRNTRKNTLFFAWFAWFAVLSISNFTTSYLDCAGRAERPDIRCRGLGMTRPVRWFN